MTLARTAAGSEGAGGVTERRHGLPSLGGANSLTKQAIFGLNSARIYDLGLQHVQNMPAMPDFSEDKLAQLAKAHKEGGGLPNNKRYGYVRSA